MATTTNDANMLQQTPLPVRDKRRSSVGFELSQLDISADSSVTASPHVSASSQLLALKSRENAKKEAVLTKEADTSMAEVVSSKGMAEEASVTLVKLPPPSWQKGHSREDACSALSNLAKCGTLGLMHQKDANGGNREGRTTKLEAGRRNMQQKKLSRRNAILKRPHDAKKQTVAIRRVSGGKAHVVKKSRRHKF